MVKSLQFIDKNGYETSILSIAELTTWKDEAVKDIGGEDAFNQEYGLRFINGSKYFNIILLSFDLISSSFIFENTFIHLRRYFQIICECCYNNHIIR